MANDPALPGFVDADQFVGSLHPVTSDAALAGPDVAVRARLNAIVLDGVVLALSAVLVSSLVGVAARSTNGLLLAGGLQFLYFFCFEAATGQTIGKRVFHIHVAALNGAPPTLRQVAMRNVLRLADALPLLYASGLISMMRTGRRRQRIGDVAAGTVVVGDTGGFALRTPRWLLPLTTLLATGLSVVLIVAILDPRASSPTVSSPTTSSPIVNAPVTSAPVPIAAAFANATRQPPLLGNWQATATVTAAIGYGNEHSGDRYTRAWTIARRCGLPSGCVLLLVRQLADGSKLGAPLTFTRDGWRATFPELSYVCAEQNGQTLLWLQHDSMALNFSDGGRRASVNERDFSSAPGCGDGTDTITWSAAHL